jgi:hypothetical protein
MDVIWETLGIVLKLEKYKVFGHVLMVYLTYDLTFSDIVYNANVQLILYHLFLLLH